MRESRPTLVGTVGLIALVAVLFLGCVRVLGLIRREVKAQATSSALRSQLPPDNSLWGIGAGPRGQAILRFGGGPDGNSRLLLFVIHDSREAPDVRFWSRTVRLVAQVAEGRRIGFWGICDSGSSCGTPRPAVGFEILGYLDPYEMRMMALADARGEALLYRGPKLAGLKVPILDAPRAEAHAILRAAE